MANNILEVKNLKVSFRTNGGTVKAVRDISFNLEKGKTLAIVGESGSGKSVTSKSILGISAGNSILEGGEILYDGKDLLRISEEEMCTIRGDKISMIFQDPLSALNPIVKIGRQITEAMLLKNKASRKNATKEYKTLLAELKKATHGACKDTGKSAANVDSLVDTFEKVSTESIKILVPYNAARTAAEDADSHLKDLIFNVENKQKIDVKASLGAITKTMKKIKNVLLTQYEARLDASIKALEDAKSSYKEQKENDVIVLGSDLKAILDTAQVLLDEINAAPVPDFFNVAYCKLHSHVGEIDLHDMEKANVQFEEYTNDHFMNEFREMVKDGIVYANKISHDKKVEASPLVDEAKAYFEEQEFTQAEAMKKVGAVCDKVEDAINRLDIVKDSVAYTLRSSLTASIQKYFIYTKRNPKEEARYARQTAKVERLEQKGKTVDYKVVPKDVIELSELRAEIVKVLTNMQANYEYRINAVGEVDLDKECDDIIAFFKQKAFNSVYKITKEMARERAIKLMEEVGIPEARLRYYQYPFEFSGGMRQRIVIAIALAADPDILICDEPTTALDVTIQSQILELINRLKEERGLSIIFITHDLGVVANMADDIAVMYAGKIVEYGTAEDIFYDPRHPYTWALLSSMPDLDTKEKLDAIPGTPPNMIYPPVGDAFAERNKYALEIDFVKQPPMFQISETHSAATWLLYPGAPEIQPPQILQDRIKRMEKKMEGAQNE